jgi:F-type H+-transporting ATPase subunit b
MAVLFAASDFGLSFALEWVGLAIVVAVVVRYVVPWLRPKMDAQIASIRAQLAATEKARLDGAELVAARSAALEQAKVEAAAIVGRARENAARLVAEGSVHASEEYAHALTRASVAIDLARARMREELIREVGALVVAVATKVIAAELDDQGHHRLIGQAIAAAESEGAN